ncbi:hypothetical protein GGR52DRAFT_556269 [Hypoxylon sp. FL1284]|nr:hypothetical protein GGR52DRAFT_556269 [Hypoxylon sp. FL1284]
MFFALFPPSVFVMQLRTYTVGRAATDLCSFLFFFFFFPFILKAGRYDQYSILPWSGRVTAHLIVHSRSPCVQQTQALHALGKPIPQIHSLFAARQWAKRQPKTGERKTTLNICYI